MDRILNSRIFGTKTMDEVVVEEYIMSVSWMGMFSLAFEFFPILFDY